MLAIVPAVEAADRDKLLSEPGVYGTFAAYSLDEDWGKQDQAVRIAQLTVLKGVVEQHREKLAIDVYLFPDYPIMRTCSFVFMQSSCVRPNSFSWIFKAVSSASTLQRQHNLFRPDEKAQLCRWHA